jgi:hypothetical protein
MQPGPAFQRQSDAWQILESQNGPGGAAIPEWLSRYFSGGVREIESLGKYQDRYVFIGKIGGYNFNAMRQWAAVFSVERDLPRLIAKRIEERMVSAASFYPDDEYGDFFASLVKEASDADYSGITIEEKFWVKVQIETKVLDENLQERISTKEQYNYFILTSDDRFRMQNKIRGIIESVKPSTPPNRDQASAISRLKRNFFEEF